MLRNVFLMLLCVSIAVVHSHSASAQGTAIVGRVVDASNNALVGVTVMVKGSTVGTATDAKGNFSIKATPTQVIAFSYLGYTPVEQVVGKRTVLNVSMQEEASTISSVEVVSVGYGTVSRRDLTGSVAKADLESIMKSNVTSFDQALSGRVAGVVVTTGDGALGAEANIVIRGSNSITQSSAPLYIIDGFPTESSLASSIPPQDIESMDILKDASATAIYGARGANGVIVITTKQGKAGKPTVNFSAAITSSSVSNKIDLMNPYEFVTLQRDIATAQNKLSELDDTYFKERTLEDYRNIAGTDWQDKTFRPALMQNYNASITGGSDVTKYSVSMSMLDQDGILPKSNFQRYQGKANLIQKLGKKVTFTLNANYSRAITNGVTPTSPQASSSSTGWLMFSLWGYRPVTPVGVDDMFDNFVDPDVDPANDYRFNPYKTCMNEYRKTILDNITSNAAIEYKINKAFTLRISGGYTYNQKRREEFNNTQTYTGSPTSASGKGVNGLVNWTEQNTWVNENTLSYSKKIAANHNLTTLVGFTLNGQTTDFRGISATKITSEALGMNGLHTGLQQVVKPYLYDWMMMSFLARLNYNYKYKYYLTASFRADGSSKFPKANQWGYFPSVGLSWNINREDFLKNEKWLSNMKLRASWGQTGNNRTQTPYDYLPQITSASGTNSSLDYAFDGKYQPGFYKQNMANPDLKWETTTQSNVGIDLGFFSDRLRLVVDWYKKDTKDLLLMAKLAPSSGYDQAMINVGKISNQGWEFSLETVNIKTRQFTWTSAFNIAFNKNKIETLVSGQESLTSQVSWDGKYNSQYPYISIVGAPAGLMFGYIYEGTYKNSDFENGILKSDVAYLGSLPRNNIRPGDPRYRDMNNDGFIDDNDRTVIGRGQPIHTGGFGNTFNYKNFDLNIFMSWSYGNDVLNANRLIFEYGKSSNTNQLRSYNNRWSENNQYSNIPRVDANGMEYYSSRVIEDASFLKIRNISLGYTFPQKFMKKAGLGSLRIYVSADNIYTLTNYSGPDPEVSVRNSVLTPGFDWSAYPRSFGITGGLNLTF